MKTYFPAAEKTSKFWDAMPTPEAYLAKRGKDGGFYAVDEFGRRIPHIVGSVTEDRLEVVDYIFGVVASSYVLASAGRSRSGSRSGSGKRK